LIEGRLDADINNRAKARFKTADMAAHLAVLNAQEAKVLAKLEDATWLSLLNGAEAEGEVENALRTAVKIYCGSRSYDAADRRFGSYIEPALAKFTPATTVELLGQIEDNQETYGRGRAAFDHPQIRDAADHLGVDTTAYKSFTKSL
jgi:hypothetical protein